MGISLAIMMLLSSGTNGFELNARSKDIAQNSVNNTIRSEYTSLDSESCKTIEFNEETSDSRQACPGYNNIPVLVSQTDGRYYVNIGGTNKNEGLSFAFNHLGEKLEWRLQNDEPFAAIYRYYIDGASDKPIGSSVLAVQKVSGKMGSCIAGVIDGNLPNANEIARRFADEKIANFKCGIDSREEISSQKQLL